MNSCLLDDSLGDISIPFMNDNVLHDSSVLDEILFQ